MGRRRRGGTGVSPVASAWQHTGGTPVPRFSEQGAETLNARMSLIVRMWRTLWDLRGDARAARGARSGKPRLPAFARFRFCPFCSGTQHRMSGKNVQMKFLVWFLIFSMLNGAFELLNVAAGDFVKRKLGRGVRRQAESFGATRTPSPFVSGSAGVAPVVGALQRKELESTGRPLGRVSRSEAEFRIEARR